MGVGPHALESGTAYSLHTRYQPHSHILLKFNSRSSALISVQFRALLESGIMSLHSVVRRLSSVKCTVMTTFYPRCIRALTSVGEFDKAALLRFISMFKARARADDEKGFPAIQQCVSEGLQILRQLVTFAFRLGNAVQTYRAHKFFIIELMASFSHVTLISAAFNLSRATKRK
jgi:hypothetical protein